MADAQHSGLLPDPDISGSGGEAESLDASGTGRQEFTTQQKLGNQLVNLRLWAVALATLVIVVLGYLEFALLSPFLSMCRKPVCVRCECNPDCLAALPDQFVLLTIAPIVAVTAIIVAILFGVFRGYRGQEIADALRDAAAKGAGAD